MLNEKNKGQAIRKAARLLKRTKELNKEIQAEMINVDPEFLLEGYCDGLREGYLEKKLSMIKCGLTFVSDASKTLGLTEEEIGVLIDDDSKIEQYIQRIKLSDYTREFYDAVHDYVWLFWEKRYMIEKLLTLIQDSKLTFRDVAYISGLEYDEFTIYVETVYGVDLSALQISKRLSVTFERDEKAKVWVITSKDVPGLVLEAETFKRAIQRLTAIPELWKMNYREELE